MNTVREQTFDAYCTCIAHSLILSKLAFVCFVIGTKQSQGYKVLVYSQPQLTYYCITLWASVSEVAWWVPSPPTGNELSLMCIWYVVAVHHGSSQWTVAYYGELPRGTSTTPTTNCSRAANPGKDRGSTTSHFQYKLSPLD